MIDNPTDISGFVPYTGATSDVNLGGKDLAVTDVDFAGHLKSTGGDFDLLDSNGNELVSFDQQASAVNEATVKNAATGNSPEIEVTGDDANIDLSLKPKGTGGVSVGGTGTSVYQEGITVNEGETDSDSRFKGNGDANLLFIDAGTDSVGIGINAPTAWVHVKAGTSSTPSHKLTAGTLLSTPEAGSFEYDGRFFYVTDSAPSRSQVVTVGLGYAIGQGFLKP